MNPTCDKFLDELYMQYQNVADKSKNEQDPKKLKSNETEMNKISNLTRALNNYINFYKIKDIKNK
jgi:hypothetical protein